MKDESEAAQEAHILTFWRENEIYRKSKKKNARGKKYYFMDGPPYATGYIHMGTALNKTLKDIALRFKRLEGYDVFDRPGYDTHGIPIELQIEKEIGSTSKKDIELYGVDKFIQKCRAYATKFIDVMNIEFENLGVWMDWSHPYLTLSDDYIEKIWGVFKEADKKDLLYLGQYPVHICPRCETAVAYNEIEYGKQKDTSIFVKFALKEKNNTYLLIWTTTPWTLPANTGVMVNPSATYQIIELSSGERWVLAKERVSELMTKLELGFRVIEELKGAKLEGWQYTNPLSPHLKMTIKNGQRVVLSARYVSTDDGTGLVHCAPGHGKEDYEVGKEFGLDAPSPVSIAGLMAKEAGKYEGKRARVVDEEIIKDLTDAGALAYKMNYEHEYPLCWRDKTPLLMISQPQWFLRISKLQPKLLKHAEQTKWIPSWAALRMKAWLEGIGDWPVSRQRYWGTPLPIWYNAQTGEKEVIGSIGELKKKSGLKNIDVHKPGIDRVEIKGKSGKPLRRVSEVLDVWFDSGVSSWAALNEQEFKKFWPADLNIEGKDQIRGWWNSQLILSEIMWGKRPFESIMMHGMILDMGKRKMSKSLGNVTAPAEIIQKYGRDSLRYYCAKLSKGEDFSLDEKEFNEIRRFFMTLGNINTFVNQLRHEDAPLQIEDQWIISRYHSTITQAKAMYGVYRYPEAIQLIETFVTFDLSRTYIQMIRERADEVYGVLHEIRQGILQLLAPIIPFLTEKIWQELREKKLVKEESIHLTRMIVANPKKIDASLEKAFTAVRAIIEAGLAGRDKAKIGLRWPLAKATVQVADPSILSPALRDIIKRQLNIKDITVKKNVDLGVELDTTLTDELEAEGFARELARKIQAERKNAGLRKGDMIDLRIAASKQLQQKLAAYIHFLAERTNSKKIDFIDEKKIGKGRIFSIKEEQIIINFS